MIMVDDHGWLMVMVDGHGWWSWLVDGYGWWSWLIRMVMFDSTTKCYCYFDDFVADESAVAVRDAELY